MTLGACVCGQSGTSVKDQGSHDLASEYGATRALGPKGLKLSYYSTLTSSSLSFMRLNLSTFNCCAACLQCQSFPNFCNHQILISKLQSAPLKDHTSSILECHLLSINIWSMWLWVFPSGEVQVYLWMFWYRNIVLLTDRVFWCGKVYYSNTIIITILM
jgi:hypothetical protein